MADTSYGALTAAQLTAYFDPLARYVATTINDMGIGAPTESSTMDYYARLFRGAAQGVGHAAFQAAVQAACDNLVAKSQWDYFLNQFTTLGQSPESIITSSLPSGWTFTSSTMLHALDAHLLRLNAANSGVPTTPASAGTLTAATTTGGAIPNCSSGVDAPYVVHTLAGANSWLESLPSPEATRVSIANGQNSYTYQIPGTVPSGVTEVRIYRGYIGGGSGTEYYDQRVTGLTVGSAYPAITIQQPDTSLLTYWKPPSWLSALMLPEAAIFWAICWGVNRAGGIQYQSSNMFSEANVVLGPSNINLGKNNPASSGIYGTRVIGTGYTAGTIASTNTPANNVQGFAGATKLRARVTSALNANATITPVYTYYDAAHGWGNAQTATLTATLSSSLGSTVTIGITAGQLVRTVPSDTVSGAASGTYIYEADNARSY